MNINKTVNIKIISLIVILLGLFSCGGNENVLIMPNGEIIEHGFTVRDIEKKFNLDFMPRLGFTGIYHDSIFSRFIIECNDSEQLLIDNNKSEKLIESLKSKRIKKITFDEIPDTKISFEKLKIYTESKYQDCEIKYTQKTEGKLKTQRYDFVKNGKVVCYIENLNYEKIMPNSYLILKFDENTKNK